MNERRGQDDAIVVFGTADDAERLAELGRVVVEERLAACVTIVPLVRSIYRWQGAVEDASEALALIKTTRGRYPALEARWKQLHPYEVPELLAVPVTAALPAYLAWLVDAAGVAGERST